MRNVIFVTVIILFANKDALHGLMSSLIQNILKVGYIKKRYKESMDKYKKFLGFSMDIHIFVLKYNF